MFVPSFSITQQPLYQTHKDHNYRPANLMCTSARPQEHENTRKHTSRCIAAAAVAAVCPAVAVAAAATECIAAEPATARAKAMASNNKDARDAGCDRLGRVAYVHDYLHGRAQNRYNNGSSYWSTADRHFGLVQGDCNYVLLQMERHIDPQESSTKT